MPLQPLNTNRFSPKSPLFSHPVSSAETIEPATTPNATHPRLVELISCADIQPRPIEWLWKNHLPIGSLSVISGDPGSGKTWVALAIAAALSHGDIPGEPRSKDPAGQPSTILYVSTQPLGAELVRPRFLALGGDPDRLLLLCGMAPSIAASASGDHETHLLDNALERSKARFLILDPLHGYLAANDQHRAHAAACLFDHLAQLAEKHRSCILLLRHLRRRSGSTAAVELSGAVRSEFLVGNSPDAPAFSALVQTKSNLAPLSPALGYRIDPTGDLTTAFRWTGLSNLTADDLQRERPIGAGLPKRKHAAEWLRQLLSSGSLTQGTVERAAQRDGVCMITVRRAKGDIAVTSTKNPRDGAWYWDLPPNPEQKEPSWGGKREI